ncbi:MAG: hypothetical protein IPN67_05680 [Bacteroidales bacterium]|nr:hypothetical protein [Bacteroidales bacterium]
MIHLKTGTALEGSALPIKYWLLAAYLLTCEEKTYSASEVHRNIDYMGSAEVDKMLGRLDTLMKGFGCHVNFEMLLLACVKNR